MHVWEDAFLFEVVDPESGEPVPDGQVGELVMSTLTREGMPILRYRTRDLTRILPGPCACGRVHRRIDRITGRSDDMLIVKGVNIYPMQIEKVLMTFAEVGKNYQIVLEREGVVERIRVRAAVAAAVLAGSAGALDGLRRRITASLHDEILVTPTVELVAEADVPRAEGKARRVVDLRGQ
jgi:phenylacetate-CoA ligase